MQKFENSPNLPLLATASCSGCREFQLIAFATSHMCGEDAFEIEKTLVFIYLLVGRYNYNYYTSRCIIGIYREINRIPASTARALAEPQV